MAEVKAEVMGFPLGQVKDGRELSVSDSDDALRLPDLSWGNAGL